MNTIARLESLRPYSSAWWCCWHKMVQAGRSTRTMEFRAKRGLGWLVGPGDTPGSVERSLLIALDVRSRPALDWRQYLRATYGASMPAPRVGIIFVPTEIPPTQPKETAA